MKVIPELEPMLNDVRHRFGSRLSDVTIAHPNEIYFDANMELVPGFCAHLYKRWSARVVCIFADDARNESGMFHLYYVLGLDNAHGFFVLRVGVSPETAQFTSLTNAIHAVDWQEREIQDLFGLKLIGHPNPRRCALHDDWPDVYPLRKDFDLHHLLPPFRGERHKLREVEGEGVFQVPVGPVHAGIIEPGHFLFSVAGEPVLYLQLRMFYVHKGTEKLFENLPVQHCVRLAESISGDSSFAHATAFCHAVERACGASVPSRGMALRTICLELERLYNHVGDIGAICTDVAFVTANMHAMRLRERLLRLNEQLAGNRLLRGMACLGGVRFDFEPDHLEAIGSLLAEWKSEFESLIEIIRDSSGTRDRLEKTGILKPETARSLGIVGVAGRASGFAHDTRRDFPHAFYDQVQFEVPVFSEGDVQRRMVVRREEILQSIHIIDQVLKKLPAGEINVPLKDIPEGRAALGYVEGWRGEIFHWIRTGPGGRLARCKVKDPSLQNWPAITEAIQGNIIPDFPVVNKSFNFSYSGTDR